MNALEQEYELQPGSHYVIMPAIYSPGKVRATGAATTQSQSSQH